MHVMQLSERKGRASMQPFAGLVRVESAGKAISCWRSLKPSHGKQLFSFNSVFAAAAFGLVLAYCCQSLYFPIIIMVLSLLTVTALQVGTCFLGFGQSRGY